jgi:hypothetical protein
MFWSNIVDSSIQIHQRNFIIETLQVMENFISKNIILNIDNLNYYGQKINYQI